MNEWSLQVIRLRGKRYVLSPSCSSPFSFIDGDPRIEMLLDRAQVLGMPVWPYRSRRMAVAVAFRQAAEKRA